MIHSRFKILEEEVRAIKAAAIDRNEQQHHNRRDKLIEDVHRARGLDVASLKIAVAKRRQLNLLTQDLQKADDSVGMNSYASRGTNVSDWQHIINKISSKRKQTQSPTSHKANKLQQTRTVSSTQKRHNAIPPWIRDGTEGSKSTGPALKKSPTTRKESSRSTYAKSRKQ